MDLLVVLVIAGAVWAVFVVTAFALCRAAGRAEAEVERAYRRDAMAPDRWRPAAL